MKQFTRTIVVLSLFLAASGLHAGETYVGASGGQTSFDVPAIGNVSVDDNGSSFKVFGGHRPLEYVGVEGGFRDFGEFGETLGVVRVDGEIQGFDVMAVGLLPVGQRFELWAKIGLMYWEAETVVQDPDPVRPPVSNDSGVDLGWGVGVGFKIGKPLRVRLEYESFSTDITDELSSITAGLEFRF